MVPLARRCLHCRHLGWTAAARIRGGVMVGQPVLDRNRPVEPEVRRFDRACIAVAATTLALGLLLCALDWLRVKVPSSNAMVDALARLSWYLVPIAVVLLHYLIQGPRKRWLPALYTSAISLLLAWLLTLTLLPWFHRAIGGAF